MYRRSNKKLSAVAVSAMVVGSTVAAVAGSANAAAPVTFTYWTSGWGTSEIAAIDSAFDAAHPGYKAEGSFIAKSDEFLPKVTAALKTNTQPTVVIDQQPYDLPFYQESGKLIPLTGKVPATNSLYPLIRKSLFYKGQQLGMALSGFGDIALYYNKADFAAAGIAAPPTTWKQLTADAIKLTDPAAKRWGFYVPLGDAEWISYDWEPVLWGDGGQLLNSAGTKAAFDSAAGVAALSTWVNLIKDKAAPSASFASNGSYDGGNAFESNAVAMVTDGIWVDFATVPKGFSYGVAPFPAGSSGPSTNIGLAVSALFQTTAAQDQAGLAFINFLSTPKEGAYIASQDFGEPDSPDQVSQPAIRALPAKAPGYNVFTNIVKYGGVRPINSDWGAVSADLYTEINDALTGSVTASQALATAAQEADASLAKNG
ncbi:MAG TPA: extracellular solute-binding protein [Acidimicrobiales bacterium]|nr:extracellular solute-binding protein [Acidimicrobiales bacterium]